MNWTYKSNNQHGGGGLRTRGVRVITPPGMRLNKDPSFAELEHWRGMHHNKFFNQNRIVTERQLIDSLNATMKNVNTKPTSANAHLILCDRARTPHKISRDIHSKAVDRYFHELPPKKAERNPKSPLKDNEVIDMKSIRQAIADYTPKIDLQLRRYMDPSRPCSPLLRRPMATSTYCAIPVLDLRPRHMRHVSSPASTASPLATASSPVSSASPISTTSHHAQITTTIPKDLDSWRRNSLTTLEKDDPIDPDSFYNKHYPLLLKSVPRRRKSAIPEDEVDEYRPMSKTPDIDMEFFDDLPAGPMPSDISFSSSEDGEGEAKGEDGVQMGENSTEIAVM